MALPKLNGIKVYKAFEEKLKCTGIFLQLCDIYLAHFFKIPKTKKQDPQAFRFGLNPRVHNPRFCCVLRLVRFKYVCVRSLYYFQIG